MDKENNISEFDSLFKQSFEGASSPVPPGVWEGVSAVTSGAAGASGASLLSKLFGLKGAAIIGSVAVVATTLVVLNQDSEELKNPTIEENPTIVQEDVTGTVSDNTVERSLIEDNQSSDSKLVQTAKASDADKSVEQQMLPNTNGQINKPEPTFVNDVQTDPTISMDENPIATDIVKNDPTIDLNASSESVCVNQKVNVWMVSKAKFKNIDWRLNGKLVASGKQFNSFLFSNSGIQTIEVNAVTENGTELQATRKIEVKSSNASFKVSQKNGELKLNALTPVKTNQWYVNQVLIKENQTSTSYVTDQEATTIVHVATGLNGCVDTAIQEVLKVPECIKELKIPNIFTPYYLDGINDEFVVDMPQVYGYRMTVYNLKDGKVVFDTDDQSKSWNGKYDNEGALVPVGYYLYRLVYECNGETSTKQDRIMVSGDKN